MTVTVTVNVTEAQAEVIREVLLQAADIHSAKDSTDLLWAASCIEGVGDVDVMNTLADLFDVQGDNDYNLGLA